MSIRKSQDLKVNKLLPFSARMQPEIISSSGIKIQTPLNLKSKSAKSHLSFIAGKATQQIKSRAEGLNQIYEESVQTKESIERINEPLQLSIFGGSRVKKE